MSSQEILGSPTSSAKMSTSSRIRPTVIVPSTFSTSTTSTSSTTQTSASPISPSLAAATTTHCFQWEHVKCDESYTHLVWVISFGTLLVVFGLTGFCGYFIGKMRTKKKHLRTKENLSQTATEATTTPGTQYETVNQSASDYFHEIPRRDSSGSIADVGPARRILRVVNPDENDTDSDMSIEAISTDITYEIRDDEKVDLEEGNDESSVNKEQQAPLMPETS